MVETILRQLTDPTTLWFIALLVILLFVRRILKKPRKYITIFLIVTILASNNYLAYQASRSLENFGKSDFKFADASLRNQILCDSYRGVITLGGVSSG